MIQVYEKLRHLNVNLQVVNGRLNIKAPKGALTPELLVEIEYYKEELIDFVNTYKRKKTNHNVIPVGEEQASYPLSSAQYRLWGLSQLPEANIAYNLSGAHVFTGDPDPGILEFCFQTLVARHEILRTVFREDEQGNVKQFIRKPEEAGFYIRISDFRDIENKERTVRENIREDFMQPFDLSAGPLMRASLFHVDEHRWIFAFTMHHIISDGWSMEIVVRELLSIYRARTTGGSEPVTPLRIQYKDYALWQQQQFRNGEFEDQKRYWLKELGGALPALNLPGDKPRPQVRRYRGGVLRKTIAAGPGEKLRLLCSQRSSTMYMGVTALVNALLYRYTQQEDIITGTPVAGREHSDVEDQIGVYINTLALRLHIGENDSYNDLLDHVKKKTLSAYENQGYPFDELVDELGIQRDMGRNALFDVVVVFYENQARMQQHLQDMPDFKISNFAHVEDSGISKFDLVFLFSQAEERIHLTIEYNSDVFFHSTIERMGMHLEQLLGCVVDFPDVSLSAHDYLEAAEKHMLITEFNATGKSFSQSDTVLDLFDAIVKSRPEARALVYRDSEMSYRELWELSWRLGDYLRKKYDIRPDDLIGICLDRSEWMIVALMGVLRAGGGYLPLDTRMPKERMAFIVADSRCKAVLDELQLEKFRGEDHVAKTVQHHRHDIQRQRTGVQPGDLAYVIYTSGSTGNPKGVLVQHSSVTNLVLSQLVEFGISPDEQILQTSDLSFDASVEQIFLALNSGASLHLIDRTTMLDPVHLQQFLLDHRITHLHTIPAVLSELKMISYPHLRRVIAGGDRCPKELAALWSQHYSFYNEYGPTEVTVTSIELSYDATKGGWPSLPIGKPVANTQVYILDPTSAVTPIGIPGEIHIAGAGLARGYLNQEELTNEKFVPNPWGEGRMYKTGDRGRWLEDGNLEFLGRNDHQIKIRGFRVETGEIESMLRRYERVRDAVVLAKETAAGDVELAAYLVSNGELFAEELKDFLSTFLPAYMIPSRFLQLETLPMTASGKVDRKELQQREDKPRNAGILYVAPRNATEEKLVEIWEDILDEEEIGVKDNFFNRGGHSLNAVRLVNRLHREFAVKIALQDIFESPVLEKQAELIMKGKQVIFTSLTPITGMLDYPLSSAQRRLWVLNRFDERGTAYNMPGVYRFDGKLDPGALDHAFQLLVERHEILRTVLRENEQGDLRQYVRDPVESGFRIRSLDLQEEGHLDQLNNLIRAELLKPFDFREGPLMRAILYRIGEDKWVFVYVMHHIISDGWSMNVLFTELLDTYNSCRRGKPASLPPLRIQYKDYAFWQQSQLQGTGLKQDKSYWLQQLQNMPAPLDLPSKKGRPAIKTYRGGLVEKRINKKLTRELKELAGREESTLFMSLLTTVYILLYRYTGQNDIIVGVPVAGREHIELEDQIGVYLNTLALRAKFKGEDSFRKLLEIVRRLTLGAFAHQLFPFDELVDQLVEAWDTSRSPVFDVMVVLQDRENGKLKYRQPDGLRVSPFLAPEHAVSKFDLTFDFAEEDDELRLSMEYNSDLFDHGFIQQMGDHLVQLLGKVVACPAMAIDELDYLGGAEKELLLEKFNDTKYSFPQHKTLAQLFEEQAARRPNDIALQFKNISLTYEELEKRSARLAGYLQKHFGLGADRLAVVQLAPGEKMIIAVLAVLRTGAAYIPIDPSYPKERMDYILNDSGAKVVIDDRQWALFEQTPEFLQQAEYVRQNKSDDTVYVFYTSGSTGEPKGCVLAHKGVVNRLEWMWRHYGFTQEDVILQRTSFSFDDSVCEIFLSLCWGARMVICEKEDATLPERLSSVVGRYGITCLHFVPSLLSNFVDYLDSNEATLPNLKTLRLIISSGEALPIELTKRWYRLMDTPLHNQYGPTETSIDSTFYAVLPADDRIPIGKPIANTRIYILDVRHQLLPVGIRGQIAIGGVGLAKGYWNKPELTSKKFITDPFVVGGRIYLTGDMGRWLPDGNVEYLGREDGQIKLRGNRIETGEIEQAILGVSTDAKQVLVDITRDGKEKLLVAYIVSEKETDAQYLRSALGGKLPGHMIPSFFIRLDSLPLTPIGKIDRKALPGFDKKDLLPMDFLAPENKMEHELIGIWQSVLENPHIGVMDNFFDLGGNSMRLIRMLDLVNRQYHLELPPTVLFTSSNIRALSQHIGSLTSKVSETMIDEQLDMSVSVMEGTIRILTNTVDEQP